MIHMTVTITKIGNSQGIMLDSALLEQARLNVGDEVNLEIQPDGALTIQAVSRPEIGEAEAAASARRLIRSNNELFRRLS